MSAPAALRWAVGRRNAMQRYEQLWWNSSKPAISHANRNFASSSSPKRSAERPATSGLGSNDGSSTSGLSRTDTSNEARKKKGSLKSGAAEGEKRGEGSAGDSVTGSPPGTSAEPAVESLTEETLAAVRSYRASSRGNPTSPPPVIKLTDKRANPHPSTPAPDQQARKDVPLEASGSDAVGEAQQDLEGGAQKMLRAGASKHPAAREQERQQTQELNSQGQQQQQDHIAQGQEQSQKQSATPGKLTETIEGEPRSRENSHEQQQPSQSSSASKEGIVIPAPLNFSGTEEENQRASASSYRVRSDASSSSRGDAPPSGGPDSGSSSGNDGSGPPTTTTATVGGQIPDLGQTRPPRIEYPFNTHAFVKRLQEAGFVKATQEQSEEAGQLTTTRRHDPSESIMELTRNSLVDRGEHVVQHHMNKTEAENQAYLYTAALSELRTEVQVRARNDAAALRSNVTVLQREVDGLSQKLREDVAAMKHDIQVDMNNRKGEAKEEQNTLEQEIQDLNNRFTISISDLKTEIEQNIKWDATRRALTVVFGSVVILIGTLAAADYFGKSDEPPSTGQRSEIKVAPRSAEELGLLPNYDEEKDDGSRYV